MDEALTGAVPAMEAGRMGVASSLTEGEPMGVGQSPQKEVQPGGAKPPRAKSNSKPRSNLRRATPTDKGLGGVGRACVKAPDPSNLSTSPSPGQAREGPNLAKEWACYATWPGSRRKPAR